MKDLTQFILERKVSYSEDEKTIIDIIDRITNDHHYGKFIDVNNLPEKLDKDIFYEWSGLLHVSPYHILKDDSFCEFYVKKYFAKVLAKAHIKRNPTTLDEIWDKYKEDFLNEYHDKLKEREKDRKESPDYYRYDV